MTLELSIPQLNLVCSGLQALQADAAQALEEIARQVKEQQEQHKPNGRQVSSDIEYPDHMERR